MLRFLYSLIALALVLSPLGMSQNMAQGGMVMAHAPAAETAMADGHCGDSPADESNNSKAMLDCMGICSAIASGDGGWPTRDALPAIALRAPVIAALSGLHPESEPPPPRLS